MSVPTPVATKMGPEAVKEAIEEALQERGRDYKRIFSLALRFEEDDTKAEYDSTTFQTMARKCFGVTSGRSLVMSDSPTAMAKFERQSGELAHEIDNVDGLTLLICHYAGHGVLDKSGTLMLCEADASDLEFSFNEVICDNWISPPFPRKRQLQRTDVLVILDCCYSGSVSRGSGPGRICEIVSSCSADQTSGGNDPYRAKRMHNTFTSRLSDIVAFRRGQGDLTIRFVDVVSQLAKDSNRLRVPQYHLACGLARIRIPLMASASPPIPASVSPSSGHQRQLSSASQGSTDTASLQAIFSVVIPDASRDLGTAEVVHWVQQLNPTLGLRLTGVYESEFTLLVFQGPAHLWDVLDRHPPFLFHRLVRGRNLLDQILPPGTTSAQEKARAGPSSQGPGLPLDQRKENIPPHP